jgi:DNA (cytosine-5)-methyltransferase 1
MESPTDGFTGCVFARWIMASSRPTFVELFSGAGLFGEAFRREGFSLLRAVEIEAAAVATHTANHPDDNIDIGDVTELTPAGRCDLLIAGPPCQGFSTLNQSRGGDPRNALCLQVARWARFLRPSLIVVENVAPFITSDAWLEMRRRLRRLGYDVEAIILNALDFKIAQNRIRSFTFASRIGMPSVSSKQQRLVTVREAWNGLPRFPDGRNAHIAPKPSDLALRRMKLIPRGGDKRDILKKAPHLAPPSWRRVAGEATDVWGRLEWDEPANTLRTCLLNPSKGRYIHPDQHRVITLREAARLHSIPDSWKFVGTPYQIARQIGNSVPLKLGEAIARACHRLAA